MKPTLVLVFTMLPLLTFSPEAQAQYPGWKHAGSVWILTTPEGADLPAATLEKDFPLLVRLHKDFFDFSQAQPDGADLRFSSNKTPLKYQIESWDAANGQASIWVRVPTIRGNDRQELKLHWGKPDAKNESSGAGVFNETNGYLSVWHLGDAVVDDVGTLPSDNINTSVVAGVIGKGRHFAGKQGVFCGEKITSYPSGGAAHSTEAWFRADKPNVTLIGWGNEGGGRGSKVRMQLRSPPHIHIDSDFSDVDAPERLTLGDWVHVMHTYENGNGRIFINGQLAGQAKTTLNIKNPARLWIGGWYHNYDFVGDLDEVRISRVARSAAWAKLQFENQKPMQSLVGPVVQTGIAFSVSQAQLTIPEGKSAVVTGKAEGAQKVYWILKRNGAEKVVAVDRLSYTVDAGRVTGDDTAQLQFKAIYPDGPKTKEIDLLIQEAIPDPLFELQAPRKWNGRDTIEVVPQVANLGAMTAKEAGTLNYRWIVSGMATIKDVVPGKLVLRRAMNSGTLTVALAVSNGGAEISRTVTIAVNEPAKDAWVERTPAPDAKPVDHQFFARDDKNEGTLFYRGTLAEGADAVFLKVYADDKLVQTETQKPGPTHKYALAAKLKPGLIKYRTEFGSKTDNRETILHTASDLVCGDVYLIDGQSNAEATDVGQADCSFTSEWIRSFGSASGSPDGAKRKVWMKAVVRGPQGDGQIGYWGLELGRRLVENQKMPVCIINGAVGGSRIDQHQRNPKNPADLETIYGRLLHRVQQAQLTHGVRGILWHQGENDQGADGPTGGFGWENYREYFFEMSAGWKRDYPNLQHMYLFQIWPRACSMGINGSDNRLREVQRTLPSYYSNLGIMSTLGVKPPGGCHFPAAGYAEFARLICPLVERDNFGQKVAKSITPPNLVRAAYSNKEQDEITLTFDQPVVWNAALASQFYLDGLKDTVSSGSAGGNSLVLKLKDSAKARTITYLDSSAWKETNILVGTNGIAALTFCEVAIGSK